jgi:glyoxylase-like metal-dependent hydrolase (beta-lactamase superfamily II)
MPRTPAYVLVETGCHGHSVAAILGPRATLSIDTPLMPSEAEAWRKRIGEKGPLPAFVLQMDSSADRAFAASHLSGSAEGTAPTFLAHQLTCDNLKSLQDSFKNNPLTGALEASFYGLDPLSLRWPRPAMAFNQSLTLHWDPILVEILHAPTVTPGAAWAHLPKDDILFVGDAITISLPPLLQEAQIEIWLETLARLRHAPFKDSRVFCSHGGWVDADALAHFANFLRAAQRKAEAIQARNDPQKDIPAAAASLLEFFTVPADRRDFAQRRLQLGLHALWERNRAPAPEKTSSG